MTPPTQSTSVASGERAPAGVVDPEWLTPDEQRAWRAFVVGSVMVNRFIDRELKDQHDLTNDDYGVLAMLSEAPDRRLRFGELAAVLRFPKAHITYRFQRLADRGLVEREECPSDARGAYAKITDEGLAMIEVAAPSHVASVRSHLLDHLTPEEFQILGTAMQRVLDAHEAANLSL